MTETLLGVRNAALHGLGLDQGPLANAAANYVERPLRNAAQNYGILNPTAPRPLYLNDPSQRQASRSRLYLLNKQRENAAALAASRKATPSGVNKPTIEYASELSPAKLNMQRRANVAAAAAENAAALAAMRAASPSGYGPKKNYRSPRTNTNRRNTSNSNNKFWNEAAAKRIAIRNARASAPGASRRAIRAALPSGNHRDTGAFVPTKVTPGPSEGQAAAAASQLATREAKEAKAIAEKAARAAEQAARLARANPLSAINSNVLEMKEEAARANAAAEVAELVARQAKANAEVARTRNYRPALWENANALAASRSASPSGVNKPSINYAAPLSPATLNMQRRANVAAAAAENAAVLAAMRAAAPSGYGTKKNYRLPTARGPSGENKFNAAFENQQAILASRAAAPSGVNKPSINYVSPLSPATLNMQRRANVAAAAAENAAVLATMRAAAPSGYGTKTNYRLPAAPGPSEENKFNAAFENQQAILASRAAAPSGVNKPTIEYLAPLSPATLNMQRRANVAAAAAENAAALAAMRAAAPSGYGTKKNYGLPAQKKLYNNNAQLQKYMKQRNSMCLTSCKMNILSKLDALIARKTKKNRSFRLQTAITA